MFIHNEFIICNKITLKSIENLFLVLERDITYQKHIFNFSYLAIYKSIEFFY